MTRRSAPVRTFARDGAGRTPLGEGQRMKSISRGTRMSTLVAVLVLVAAACNNSAGASPTPVISPLANSEWQLSSMLGRPTVSGTAVTLNFAVIKAGGFSGCNQYSMQYATLDTGIRFGAIAGTRAL